MYHLLLQFFRKLLPFWENLCVLFKCWRQNLFIGCFQTPGERFPCKQSPEDQLSAGVTVVNFHQRQKVPIATIGAQKVLMTCLYSFSCYHILILAPSSLLLTEFIRLLEWLICSARRYIFPTFETCWRKHGFPWIFQNNFKFRNTKEGNIRQNFCELSGRIFESSNTSRKLLKESFKS